jgi:hypothetical protein
LKKGEKEKIKARIVPVHKTVNLIKKENKRSKHSYRSGPAFGRHSQKVFVSQLISPPALMTPSIYDLDNLRLFS